MKAAPAYCEGETGVADLEENIEVLKLSGFFLLHHRGNANSAASQKCKFYTIAVPANAASWRDYKTLTNFPHMWPQHRDRCSTSNENEYPIATQWKLPNTKIDKPPRFFYNCGPGFISGNQRAGKKQNGRPTFQSKVLQSRIAWRRRRPRSCGTPPIVFMVGTRCRKTLGCDWFMESEKTHALPVWLPLWLRK